MKHANTAVACNPPEREEKGKRRGSCPGKGLPAGKKAGGADVREERNPASCIRKAETTEEFYADQFFHKCTDGIRLHFPDAG